MIKLDKVCKHYGSGENAIRAVDNVSFEIGDGEFVVITGHSGSGKTTLLNLIGGMTRADRGEITVAGRKLLEMPDSELSKFRARNIGFIFQFQSMMPTLDVLENVRLPYLFTEKEDDEDAALSLLDKVGLGNRIHAYAHQLSAGQQRRVGIARALINKPDLLLCDEPTGDLDPETETVIMDTIAEANKNGTTVIMATHNLDLRSYATGSFIIESGKITPQ